MPKGFKLRDCCRCSLPYVELPAEEVSRKQRLAAMLCHNCTDEFDKFKKKNRISPIYYLGRDEPIPEKFRYNPESLTAFN